MGVAEGTSHILSDFKRRSKEASMGVIEEKDEEDEEDEEEEMQDIDDNDNDKNNPFDTFQTQHNLKKRPFTLRLHHKLW